MAAAVLMDHFDTHLARRRPRTRATTAIDTNCPSDFLDCKTSVMAIHQLTSAHEPGQNNGFARNQSLGEIGSQVGARYQSDANGLW